MRFLILASLAIVGWGCKIAGSNSKNQDNTALASDDAGAQVTMAPFPMKTQGEIGCACEPAGSQFVLNHYTYPSVKGALTASVHAVGNYASMDACVQAKLAAQSPCSLRF